MKFSKRTEWNVEETDLARAYRARRAAGLPIADLTASNPTRCGFAYPADGLEGLRDAAAWDYDPDPRGQWAARAAICRYYASHGAATDPSSLVLTTSTSEAYGYLFKLLCNPGEGVLVAQPGYPLFDFLAQAESVEVASVALVYDHGWQIDLEGLRRQITADTRAIVLVHPNNPTGHFTTLEEGREVAAICREHQLALIVDEVFLDYPVETTIPLDKSCRPELTSFAARELDCLTFIVSGISKICGLPQMKAAWLLAHGPGSEAALDRLEVLADTWLSMNAPVQLALPRWLETRSTIQTQIQQRVAANLTELDRELLKRQAESGSVNRLKVEGGWYAILRVPAMGPDVETAAQLLKVGVWLHPGSFFGMRASGWLVVSLLTPKEEFSRGLRGLSSFFAGNEEG